MSRYVDISKEVLTPDEQEYVDARNYLRTAREEYLGQPSAHSESPKTGPEHDEDDDAEDEEEAEDDEGSSAVNSAEEWVASASKVELVAELKRRKIQHDAKANKDDLGALLIAAVQDK